jgi:hypothetical protein
MKFILTFTVPSETRDEAMARFLETGGRPPRSHAARALDPARSLRGVFLLESEDARSLTAFGHGWSNLLELTMGRSWRIKSSRRRRSGPGTRQRRRRYARQAHLRRHTLKTRRWYRKRDLGPPIRPMKKSRERTRGPHREGQD